MRRVDEPGSQLDERLRLQRDQKVEEADEIGGDHREAGLGHDNFGELCCDCHGRPQLQGRRRRQPLLLHPNVGHRRGQVAPQPMKAQRSESRGQDGHENQCGPGRGRCAGAPGDGTRYDGGSKNGDEGHRAPRHHAIARNAAHGSTRSPLRPGAGPSPVSRPGATPEGTGECPFRFSPHSRRNPTAER